MEKCLECEKAAEYMRKTQFSGNHPFCKKHAKNKNDFKKEQPGYFYWVKL